MSVPDTVTNYLRANGVDFRIIPHTRSRFSTETAHSAHVPGDQLAKAVLLDDGEQYLLAVIPSTHRVDPEAIVHAVHRWVKLVPEEDFGMIFRDCRNGAVPAVGEAYGIATFVDDELSGRPDVYFEAGDHEHLVCIRQTAWLDLVERAERGRFSYHA